MQLITGENEFFEKPFSPSVLRFCFLQAHYRSVLDISNEAMLASEKGFDRLLEAVKTLSDLKVSSESSFNISEWKQKCLDALLDDFNSPILIANMFEAVKFINATKEGKATVSASDLELLKETLNAFIFDVLGLQDANVSESNNEKLEGVVNMLIGMRNQARADKNFALSDQIRDELLAIGIQLKDGKEGTSFSY